MSSSKLGIFDPLTGYLTSAFTECPGGVQSCAAMDKICNKYFLQKYYPSKHLTNARDEDVVAQFTNAVVKLGQNLRKYDVSVGASPSLSGLLQDVAKKYINELSIISTDETPVKVAEAINTLLIKTSYDSASKSLKFVSRADNFAAGLKKAFTDAIDMSTLTLAEKTNAKLCITAESTSLKVDGVTKCIIFSNTLSMSDMLLTLDTAGTNVANVSETINSVKTLVLGQVLTNITKWINDNYDVSSLRVTGTSDDVKRVLTALISGTMTEVEKNLFNAFFLVVKDDKPVAISEIDGVKLDEYRLNCRMGDFTIVGASKKLPIVVNYIPVLTKMARVRYNKGENISPATDATELLREIFSIAYTNDSTSLVSKLGAILPSFDITSPSDLQLDIQYLIRDIVSASNVPHAHISESDTEKIDQVLKGIWTRTGVNTWKHKLSDGSIVRLNPGTSAFDEEIASEIQNCPAVGFSDDAGKCAEFFKNVGLSNTEELAKMATSMTNEVTASAVAKLHPRLALSILKTFGFHKKVCMDKVAGRKMHKVQTVQEWKEKFVDKHFKDSAVATNIKGNERLCNFLNLLTQLVNGNPSVLNEEMVDVETEESRGETVVPPELAERKISAARSKKSGTPVVSWGNIQSNMNKVYGSFSKGLTFDGMSSNAPFGMDNLFPQMSMLTSAPVVRSSTWGSMAGGGDVQKTFLQDHETGFEYSRNVGKIIMVLIDNLKRNSNKTLTTEEIKSIGDKLARFEDLERELYETAVNIQKYSQLLKIVEAENKPELITVSHVKQYVDKYNHLMTRYDKTGSSFNTLISLLKDCCEGGEGGENCNHNEPL